MDNVEKRKFLIPPVLELDPSVVQPVASCYTDCAIVVYLLFPVSTEKRKNIHTRAYRRSKRT
jgi:hypothetical protein